MGERWLECWPRSFGMRLSRLIKEAPSETLCVSSERLRWWSSRCCGREDKEELEAVRDMGSRPEKEFWRDLEDREETEKEEEEEVEE